MAEETLRLGTDDQELLEQVRVLGAATAIELAVKTLRQPDEGRPKLEWLFQAGVPEGRPRNKRHERHI